MMIATSYGYHDATKTIEDIVKIERYDGRFWSG